jgi:hypothetical protein
VLGTVARRRQLAVAAARRFTPCPNGLATVASANRHSSINSSSSSSSIGLKRKFSDGSSSSDESAAGCELDDVVIVVPPQSSESLQYVSTAAVVFRLAAAMACAEERGYVLRGMQLLTKLSQVHCCTSVP